MADMIVPINNEESTEGVEAAQATQQLQGLGTGGQTIEGQTNSAATQLVPNDALALDTAQLSETAQVVLLEQQGLTVSEIAEQLGIPQVDVEGDLGNIVNSTQAGGTPPAQVAGASPYSQNVAA